MCAAIIIGDADPGPQTAVPEGTLTAKTGISPPPSPDTPSRPGIRTLPHRLARTAAHSPTAPARTAAHRPSPADRARPAPPP